MIDHLTLTVRDLARSRNFYGMALAPLGYAVRMEFDGMLGVGPTGKPAFWLKQGEVPTQPMHIAFVAADRPGVDAFHAAALAAGAADNGAPGLRPDYHPNYYAAFVFDPDGHPIEAVCHRSAAPAGARKKAPRAAPAPRAAKGKAARARPRRRASKRR